MKNHRYSDEAISGTTSERPGYQKMLVGAEAGEFEVLLVDDLSRLSRNNAEFLRVLEELAYLQIRVIAPSDGFDSGRENYEIEATVHGLKNSIYIRDLGKKVRRGMTGLALRGFSCGGRLFGYRHEEVFDPLRKNADGEPLQIGWKRVIDREQEPWVIRIFEWYAEGRSPRWITNELNRLKVPARRSNVHFWTVSTVRRLLENETFIGIYTWNRHRFIKKPNSKVRKKILRPESEWVRKEMPELRIVSDELWSKVQARFAEQMQKTKTKQAELHANARTGATGKFLFSGLLKCSCGNNFAIINATDYGCSGRKQRGEAHCTNNFKIDRKVLENTLLEAIRTDLFSPEAISLFQKEIQRLLAENARRKSSNKDDHSRRLAQVEQEIANLLTAIKAGILTPTTKSELERLEAEKKSLERTLAQNPGLDKVIAFLPNAIGHYKRLVDDLGNTLQSDIVRARHQLRCLLGDDGIRLVPEGNGLTAEIKGDYAGFLHIAVPKINAQSVSRVRFYDSPR